MASRTPSCRPGHSCPPSSSVAIMRAFMTILCCSLVAVPTALAQSRGELLYTTHCIACHTTEMHWRDRRAASPIEPLRAGGCVWSC